MAHILIVEDELSISKLLCKSLALVGHRTCAAFTGEEACRMAQSENFDMAILDVMLPDTDGFSLLARLKPLPVLFLSARGEVSDRIKGLRLGAEDYLPKPFEMQELLARVQVVLRRGHKLAERFSLDGVDVDLDARTVSVQGAQICLTPQEFALLEALIRNRNIALSREQLLSRAWGVDYLGEDRTVDVHIQKLRKKLGWEKRIKTIYKLGYRLEYRP